MALYMVQVAYTPESWTAMVKVPQDRLQAVKPVIERLGGKVVDGWLSFGKYDLVAVFELPDDVSAAAFAMAVSATGAVKDYLTTPLITIQQGTEAMKKAARAGYQPPGYASYG
jgi:uncharacterized protein with GYD domain